MNPPGMPPHPAAAGPPGGDAAAGLLAHVIQALAAYVHAEPDPADQHIAAQCLAQLQQIASGEHREPPGAGPAGAPAPGAGQNPLAALLASRLGR